jgi:hypothetical protein
MVSTLKWRPYSDPLDTLKGLKKGNTLAYLGLYFLNITDS